MNRRAMSVMGIIISVVTFIIVVLASPFMFEFLGVVKLSGVEGFFARLIPFLMLFMTVRAGAYAVVRE